MRARRVKTGDDVSVRAAAEGYENLVSVAPVRRRGQRRIDLGASELCDAEKAVPDNFALTFFLRLFVYMLPRAAAAGRTVRHAGYVEMMRTLGLAALWSALRQVNKPAEREIFPAAFYPDFGFVSRSRVGHENDFAVYTAQPPAFRSHFFDTDA